MRSAISRFFFKARPVGRGLDAHGQKLKIGDWVIILDDDVRQDMGLARAGALGRIANIDAEMDWVSVINGDVLGVIVVSSKVLEKTAKRRRR